MTLVMLPTVEESRANWDKLSDVERKEVEVIENLQAKFADGKLSEASQLPEIASPSFVLHWDFVHAGFDSETLIKHGDTIIFREPVIFEGYERFIEVAEILRARYGAALHDLVPTDPSLTYLYGDSLSSPGTVAKARKRIFSDATENPLENMSPTYEFRPLCLKCGEVASTIQLFKESGKWQLVYDGPGGGNASGDEISDECARAIITGFAEPYTVQGIRAADFFDDGGFCLECSQFYCSTHWRGSAWGGGTCPKGHFKGLDPHWSPDLEDI